MTSHDQVFNTGHYVWSGRDRLGYGATGAVFVGYNKTSGDRVAIKVFTGGADFRALKREIDVVRQLPQHENIVKLFSVEDERTFHQQVIIMELCTGGSLYEVIDSPENAYGLCEDEFKQVIFDVAKGLQHLRKHNFIHRDIKPGNIMRCQNPDGSYIFKLADFGTARELAPGETFLSLHGTEEYLYPGMYERALVNPQKKHQFPAKVDLWSVGATFFHAATGRLPFQPFRKRDDRELMFRMISTKESGVISGWQLEPNGGIIYSKTLPPDTQISLGMKLLITPVLAGLLENKTEKMVDFNEFFKHIEMIHRKKVVDVFCVLSCTCHRIYIDPEEKDAIPCLKRLIQDQTSLDVQFQDLFYENLPYRPKEPLKASDLPVTTEERPLFVFGGIVKKTADLETPITPSLPSVPQGFALSSDVHFAKDCAKVMWYFRSLAELINRMFRLMHQAALCFGYTVQHEYDHLERELCAMEALNEATCRVLTSQVAGLKNLKDTLAVVNQATDRRFINDLRFFEQEIRAKQESHIKITEAPTSMRNKLDKIRGQASSVTDAWDPKYSSDVFHRSVDTLQFMAKSVDSNYRTFLKERKLKAMSPHDQKVHEFTKVKLHRKLDEAQDKTVALFTGRDQVYSKLGKWFLRVLPLHHDVDDISKMIKSHIEECNAHLDSLNQWEAKHSVRLSQLHQRLGAALSDSTHHTPHPAAPIQVELPSQLLAKLQQSTNELAMALQAQRTKLENLPVPAKSGHSLLRHSTNTTN